MNICDQGFCWLCSMPESCCDCELYSSPWSASTSQASFYTFDGCEKPADDVVGVLGLDTIRSDYFLGGRAFKDQSLDTNDTIQCPSSGCGSRPYAPSTPTHNNVDDTYSEKWKSPDVMPPPDSSSPVDLCDMTVEQCVKAPSKKHFSITTPATGCPSHLPTPKFHTRYVYSGTHLSMDAQESLDEGLYAIRTRQDAASDSSVNLQDICALRTRPFTEQTNHREKLAGIDLVSARGNIAPASRRRAVFPDAILLDLAISAKLKTASSHGTENDRPHNATTANSEIDGNDGVPSKMPLRKASIIPVSSLAQPMAESSLKRRRSSIDDPPESKKLKLNRTVSDASCVSDASATSKYQASEPASLRRAQSLRSEISACSEVSTDSLFYPSPLTPPAFQPSPVKDYPPTVPCTPMPSSVDYARSRANPMIRTIAVHRHRSVANIPEIPPVPIIAPPAHTASTSVRCAEDYAIDRLKALLLRERSERERDRLHVHDEKRTQGLKATSTTAEAFSRRDSASTCESSDGRGQWEDETTIESQESQDSASGAMTLLGQHRLANREIWSNAFAIVNGFRKDVTEFILKELPKKTVPRKNPSRNERRHGIDLYDQLTNSRQTRFHAAQLFHRYLLLPDKADLWGDICKRECSEQKFWKLHNTFGWWEGVWDLAVGCIALSVKLHRDCLPPLDPVYAAEFIAMAPHSMTHETFELAQRDIMYSFDFLLGSCTPQDILDELWDALPTLRKATRPVRDCWAVVQNVIWDKLFEALFEPDMLQYPVSLLTAAALINGLILVLERHYKTEAEGNLCKCKAMQSPALEGTNNIEPTSGQVHLYEARQAVADVILDVKSVLQLSDMELDECRVWLSCVGCE